MGIKVEKKENDLFKITQTDSNGNVKSVLFEDNLDEYLDKYAIAGPPYRITEDVACKLLGGHISEDSNINQY